MRHTEYADTCEVYNFDSGKTVTADVLSFQPERSLTVSINRAIKVTLHYQERGKKYIGSASGFEFWSDGPEGYTYRTNR